MEETFAGITVQLKGSLIVFKNKEGETFKAIDVSAGEALGKFNGYVKLLKAKEAQLNSSK